MAQEDGHHDLQLGEEVASTTPHVSRRPTFRAAARVAPQRPAARASVVQSVPAPNGLLMAARELLRNPPGEAASPDALISIDWTEDNGVTTSTASSTWRRLTHAQRGGLFPGNAIVRAAHPVLCTHHQ
jgi:hypothetical protein